MKKAIITVVGKDTVGIIARVCTYLAEDSCNILDISQTITGGYFNMMMIAETSETSKTTEEVRHELQQIGQEIGVDIHVQHEGIFEMMHRI